MSSKNLDQLIVQCLMAKIEDYRMSGGRVEHHARKEEIMADIAGLVANTKIQPCPGIPRNGCNYTAKCNSVCNKCGHVHHSHMLTTHRPSTDRAATVSNEVHWIEIDATTPRGTKVWLINKDAGSATQGQYDGSNFFTHWHPLPRFRKGESNET